MAYISDSDKDDMVELVDRITTRAEFQTIRDPNFATWLLDQINKYTVEVKDRRRGPRKKK